MLVLSRKQGESIIIQERIRVSVLKVHQHRVRIGITAPGDTAIRRKEIVDETPREVTICPSEVEH